MLDRYHARYARTGPYAPDHTTTADPLEHDRPEHGRSTSPPPELLELLEELEADARAAARAIAEGRATTGVTALGKIAHKAADGARWARDPDAGELYAA